MSPSSARASSEGMTVGHRLRFGFITAQNAPWPALVERWRYLERLGFDTAWVADHFVNPNEPTQSWLEAWTLLAGLAARTERIRVGTLVTNISLRHPALLAREALTVDHISNGRLELGLGPGGAPLDHSMLGGQVWEAPERVRRFREVVALVDSLLRAPTTSYQGRYYRVHEAIMRPAAVQQPRPALTIAAHGPAMLKVAARYADTWNTTSTQGRGRRAGLQLSAREMLDATRERGERLEEYVEELGRDPRAIRRSFVFVAGVTPETPWATVDAFRDFVGRYREIGISEFIFHWPRDGITDNIEHVAIDVLSELRGATSGT
jgi:alkanesulfonate monooxygenase SsuD/methylene tetrahydromethanopterin reductase-like flavin-dependent oxidoreductase (luciferase family)